MCGIIAGIAQRDIAPILLEGLKRLEYRGYDSAGLAIIQDQGNLERLRVCGKVKQLFDVYEKEPLTGKVGIAHTRWATHGKPNESNAHPHAFQDKIALVHNGIIENYLPLKEILLKKGAQFTSDTDSEVVVQWIGMHGKDLLSAVQETVAQLKGAYALAVISKAEPGKIIAARQGSPLVIGIGISEHFIASDSLALLPVTQDYVVLEEGDVAEITREGYVIYDKNRNKVERSLRKATLSMQNTDRGKYRHFMQKEIFEQPEAVRQALAGRLEINDAIFGENAAGCFDKTNQVQIVACGTSFHAGLVAKNWIEKMVRLPCFVEEASEFRYRDPVVLPGTLLVVISQSGETADTLAALRGATAKEYCGKLAICNVPESSLVREAELIFLTHAGPEIGVASTKAFTTQLVGLLMLVHCLGKRNNKAIESILPALQNLPQSIEQALEFDKVIATLAQRFHDKAHALFIGRGICYPIVKEGALKLKEISYIHAEAYPAGELKHGPLALVDKHMPVIALVQNDHLLEKLRSNLEEVRARQGELIVFTEKGTNIHSENVIEIPPMGEILAPISFSVLLQLLAYHVAVLKGTDVDQPRNLAKSVTVE